MLPTGPPVGGAWRRVLEKDFARALLYDQPLSVREIWECTRSLGLPEPPCLCIYGRMDHFQRLAREHSERWCSRARAALVSAAIAVVGSDRGLVTSLGREALAVLLVRVPGESLDSVEQRALELARWVLERGVAASQCSLTLGVGRAKQDARQLPLSFQEAQYAESSKFYLGVRRVISFREVPEPSPVSCGQWWACQEEVVRGILQLEPSRVLSALGHLFRLIEEHFPEPKRACHLAVETLRLAAMAAEQLGLERGPLVVAHERFRDEAFMCETLSELRALTTKVASDIVVEVRAQVKHGSAGPVGLALRMVEQARGRLRVRDLARAAGVSPAHLSRLFRARTGSTCKQELLRARMAEAHRLLTATDLPLGQVARMAGYGRQSSFSRAFRRHFGVTPTQLRRLRDEAPRVAAAPVHHFRQKNDHER